MNMETRKQLKLYTRDEAERMYQLAYRVSVVVMPSLEFYWYMLETDCIRSSGVDPMPFEEWRLLQRIVESRQ